MHWECQSNWIPFLSKIAPSDDLEIWKVGGNLRLDFSLVGFQKLSNKRRKMSFLIRDTTKCNNETGKLEPDFLVILINKDKGVLINPLEDLDEEEKLSILTDMINSDPVNSNINIKSQKLSEVHSIFGGQVSETIGDYQCLRYRINVLAQASQQNMVIKKNGEKEVGPYDNQRKSAKSSSSLAEVYLRKNLRKYFGGCASAESDSTLDNKGDNISTKEIETDIWLSR